MVFTDGECPICLTTMLFLNEKDLFECPDCNLMISLAGRPLGTILENRGSGAFRIEDCDLPNMEGLLLAKSDNKIKALPDDDGIFKNVEEIKDYLKDRFDTSSKDFELWLNFKNALHDLLDECERDEVYSFWAGKKERTKYYKEILMPRIAEKLKLIHGKEEFTVDYAMSKSTGSGIDMPQIYIESENDIKSADHEIRKLSSLNSPLRVLLTVDNFDEKNKSATLYDCLRDWQQIIRTHAEHNPSGFNGTIAIISGGIFNGALSFHSCAFWANGSLRQPLAILWKDYLK